MSLLTSIKSGPVMIDRHMLVSALHAHIAERTFPCVGAKSAMNSGALEVVTAWSLTSAWDDLAIHKALLDWSKQYETDSNGLRSLAVVFSEPGDLTEAEFEKALWERVQSLANKDKWLGTHRIPARSGAAFTLMAG